MDYLGLCLDLETKAVSQYTNYDFNSICTFNGVHLGANGSGIFVLDSGDDDAGTAISARFRTHLNDFGTSHVKKARKFYIGGEGNGLLDFKTLTNESSERTKRIDFSKDAQQGAEIPGRRDTKGKYWSVEIQNVSGSDFSIDSIQMIPVVNTR